MKYAIPGGGLVGLSVAFALGTPRVSADEPDVRDRLARVQSAAYYEIVTDGASIGRSQDEMVRLLQGIHAQLIFRGFMQGPTVPEDAEEPPAELLRRYGETGGNPARLRRWYRENGYGFTVLQATLPVLKRELPGVIFIGGIAAQFVSAVEVNAVTGKVLGVDDTWRLAFDPARWKLQRDGRALSKEQLQSGQGLGAEAAPKRASYDWRRAATFFPDLTLPGFHDLLLARAQRQMDAGADGIWIDLLFRQAALVAQLGGDVEHAGVREAYDAAGRMVDEIHRHGAAHGRSVLVGTWALPLARFPFPAVAMDFLTMTPQVEEMQRRQLDTVKWETELRAIRARYSMIPVVVFIDCAGHQGVMAKFSQELSPAEQQEMLRQLDTFCRGHGLIFASPVHGGGMGDRAAKLSFGRSRFYDSAAPEFATYATIKQLADRAAATPGGR